MKPELLSETEIQQFITSHSDWRVEGRELVKEFRFSSYLAGIDFVRQAGDCAEGMNHHPDMLVGWRKVTVRVSTHSTGGLTGLDVELAGRIEGIAPAPGTRT